MSTNILEDIRGLVSDLRNKTLEKTPKFDTKNIEEPVNGEDSMKKNSEQADIEEQTPDTMPEEVSEPSENLSDYVDDESEDANAKTDSSSDLESQIIDALSAVINANPDVTAEDVVECLQDQLGSETLDSSLQDTEESRDVSGIENGNEDVAVLPEETVEKESSNDDEDEGDAAEGEVSGESFYPPDGEESATEGEEPSEDENIELFSDEDKEKKKKDSEDTNEDESDEDEESMNFEASSKLKLKFIEGKTPDSHSWAIYRGKTPLMKVSAAQAFGEYLAAKPSKNDYPKQFDSYADVFRSYDYGQELLRIASTQGLEKACSASNGILVTAQVGPGSVSPQGVPGVRATDEQPFQNSGISEGLDISNQQPTEGGGDTNFNPSKDAEQDMLEGGDEKLLVTDLLTNFLAMLIANRSYSIDEIMNELTTTFSDESTIAEFRGALKEHADAMAHGSTEDKPQETDGNLPAEDLNKSQLSDSALGSGDSNVLGEDDGTLGSMDLGASSQIKAASIEEKDAIINALIEEKHLRYKIASCVEFIKQHMQTRGVENIPLVPTARYLMESENLSKSAAIEKETQLIYKKAEELVQLNDAGWNTLTDYISRLPEISDDSFNKTASINNSTSHNVGIFMQNEESTSKFDNAFPDELFESRISKIAREKNQERYSRKRVF